MTSPTAPDVPNAGIFDRSAVLSAAIVLDHLKDLDPITIDSAKIESPRMNGMDFK